MLRFLMQRLLALVPVLFTVAVIVFLILRLTPGDPAAVIAGNNATNEDIDRIREQLGLTKPVITQFMIWLGQVMQGDLGYSFYLNRPVTELIAQRIEPTMSLAAGTMVLAVLIAVPLGTIAAWRMGGWLDHLLSGFAVAGFSVPVFVIGYVLIYIFAVELQWLPVQGYRRLFGASSQGVGPWAMQLVLPWCSLATIYVALIARNQGHINGGQRTPGQHQLHGPWSHPLRGGAKQAAIALHRQPLQLNGKDVDQHIANHKHRHRKARHRKPREQVIEPAAHAPSGDRAQRNGYQHSEHHGASGQGHRGFDALRDQFGNRSIEIKRVAQVALHHLTQPDHELRDDGLGQAQLLTDAIDVFVGGVVTRNHGGRIPGREPQDQKHDHRHREQHRDQRQQALHQKTQHGAVAPSGAVSFS